MIDPAHAAPGRLIAPLALDACVPLYGLLHAPPDDGSLRLHAFLKQVIEYAKFTPSQPALWEATKSYAQATLPVDEANAWLSWIYNAFTGLHPPDVDLSGWLMAMDYFRYRPDAWKDSGMSAAETGAATALVDRYFAELNEDAFIAAVAECQARPLSAWDKRMHQAYGFVYFDRASGADPFLALKFVYQGEALRRALRATNLSDAQFPAAALHRAAQAMIDERGVWMPPGRTLGPLSTLL